MPAISTPSLSTTHACTERLAPYPKKLYHAQPQYCAFCTTPNLSTARYQYRRSSTRPEHEGSQAPELRTLAPARPPRSSGAEPRRWGSQQSGCAYEPAASAISLTCIPRAFTVPYAMSLPRIAYRPAQQPA
eukprot:2019290-Rhodomonas_salina.3